MGRTAAWSETMATTVQPGVNRSMAPKTTARPQYRFFPTGVNPNTDAGMGQSRAPKSIRPPRIMREAKAIGRHKERLYQFSAERNGWVPVVTG